MISITFLRNIFWRFITTRLFDSIRPRICHSCVYRLEGKTKPSESNLSAIIFGRKESAEYFSKLIYIDEPKFEFLGKRALSDIPSFVDKATEDLIIVETNWFFSRFLLDNGFLILPQINFVLDITDSLETIQSRMASSKIRRINKLVKSSYTYEITKDPAKLQSFYYEMYLPHMFARHGKSARPVNFSECKKLFLKGSLMLIKLGQEYISGIILVPHGNELYQPLMAVKNIDKQITLGSYAATYYTIILGKQKGYASIDFGDAPPFLQDGLFQYKKEWGMKMKPSKRRDAQVLAIKFGNFGNGTRDFISANPFIFIENEEPKGLAIFEPKENLQKAYHAPGLSDLIVICSTRESLQLKQRYKSILGVDPGQNALLGSMLKIASKEGYEAYNLKF